MRNQLALLIAGLLLTTIAGCMRTRYVETSSISGFDGGGCSPSTYHDSTYKERRWCGPWFGQPCQVQP